MPLQFPETPDRDPSRDLDPRFVFDFHAYDELRDPAQRWSTWLDVEPLMRGPEPRPDWVVTSQGLSTPSSASSRRGRRQTSSSSSAPTRTSPGQGS